MNPEFERNVWLELTPRRMLLMVGLLSLTFFAASLPGGLEWGPSHAATILYYFIVVVWGARNASMAVVGEIRDRTWDMQRLSSLSAGDMTWGKLFGSTIYNWFGGALCLVLVMVNIAAHMGLVIAAIELIYYIGIAVIAQSASLLASLIAIRRRQSHSRLDLFVYQAVGLSAAIAVYLVWTTADPVAAMRSHVQATDSIRWWSSEIDSRAFLLTSVVIFAAWTLLGCIRQMRLELKMRNAPDVWLIFLAFIGVYVAGFDAWLSPDMKTWDAASLRLLLAATTFGVLTYLMVFLEPKDRVHYRWMLAQFGSGHFVSALSGVQAWMMSYGATMLTGAILAVWSLRNGAGAATGQSLVLSGLGFVTRDVAIFVLMQTLPGRQRGDLSALMILIALYVLVPAILEGLHANALMYLFFPQLSAPPWLGAAAAWVEGIVVATLALTRLALVERNAKPATA